MKIKDCFYFPICKHFLVLDLASVSCFILILIGMKWDARQQSLNFYESRKKQEKMGEKRSPTGPVRSWINQEFKCEEGMAKV